MHEPSPLKPDANLDAANQQSIDLNGDVGEGTVNDRSFIPLMTSVNIACGSHAGNDLSIVEALEIAAASEVQIGAHPGFADPTNFGRKELSISAEEAYELVARQVEHLAELASQRGVKIGHIKLHGALYHQSARDLSLARAVARAALAFDERAIIVGPGGSVLERIVQRVGLRFVCEAFVDRVYDSLGLLISRTDPQALITDEARAVAQTLQIVCEGAVTSLDGALVPIRAETICLHGDNTQASRFAFRLRRELLSAGIAVRPFILNRGRRL